MYSSTVSTHFQQTLSALTMSQEQLISRQNEQIVATKLGEALAPRPLTTATSSPNQSLSRIQATRGDQLHRMDLLPRDQGWYLSGCSYIMMNVMCNVESNVRYTGDVCRDRFLLMYVSCFALVEVRGHLLSPGYRLYNRLLSHLPGDELLFSLEL